MKLSAKDKKRFMWLFVWTGIYQVALLAGIAIFWGMQSEMNQISILMDSEALALAGVDKAVAGFYKIFVPVSGLAGTVGITQGFACGAPGERKKRIGAIVAIMVGLMVLLSLLFTQSIILPMALCEIYLAAACLIALTANASTD